MVVYSGAVHACHPTSCIALPASRQCGPYLSSSAANLRPSLLSLASLPSSSLTLGLDAHVDLHLGWVRDGVADEVDVAVLREHIAEAVAERVVLAVNDESRARVVGVGELENREQERGAWNGVVATQDGERGVMAVDARAVARVVRWSRDRTS